MRIGITQRVEVVSDYGEVRDCLDQAWTSLLNRHGLLTVPLSNRIDDPAGVLSELDIQGLILSGGNDLSHLPHAANTSAARDKFESVALEWAIENSVPVFGVCRGMQVLNHYFGGYLVPTPGHAGTTHPVDFSGRNIQVNSYHGWGIPSSGLGKTLLATAVDSDGFVEAFRSEKLPVVGIMWHPERDNPASGTDDCIIRELFR